MNKGFTLIELAVVIAIIAVLSGIILVSVKQYSDKGKDSNILGNLAILIPAGEVYYNGFPNAYGDDDNDFCGSSVVANAIAQMPVNPSGVCYDSATNPAGLCCYIKIDYLAWAACAQKFTNPDLAYCVDSRGMKKEIDKNDCVSIVSTTFKCPQ